MENLIFFFKADGLGGGGAGPPSTGLYPSPEKKKKKTGSFIVISQPSPHTQLHVEVCPKGQRCNQKKFREEEVKSIRVPFFGKNFGYPPLLFSDLSGFRRNSPSSPLVTPLPKAHGINLLTAITIWRFLIYFYPSRSKSPALWRYDLGRTSVNCIL